MPESKDYNAIEAATLLLNEYREGRKHFHVFDDYDLAMGEMRATASEKISSLQDPIKSIASRLFAVIDKGFFLVQVCEWKMDYLAEALIHAIETKNPISLANNTRALVEHLATLVAITKELERLHDKLLGQGHEKTINELLERAEKFIHRAYYGKSPKITKKGSEQALHVNECIKALKEDVSNIDEIYDFLCEYVHPNYGSNSLVSTGQLANGRLNPPEESQRDILDRLRRICSLCMLFMRDHAIVRGRILLEIQSLFEFCFVKGVKVNNVFAIKAAKPDGDGKTKETAYFFHKARTKLEAMKLCYEFLQNESCEVGDRTIGAIEGKFIFDVYKTHKGDIWFKVPVSF